MKKTTDNPILAAVTSAKPINSKGQVDKWADNKIGDFYVLDGVMGFFRHGKDSKNGQINYLPTNLTDNFIALIAEQIILDDGAKQETAFLIEGKQKNGPILPPLTISAVQFQMMQWPLRHWGARAIVEADQATPRRLANAILKLSGNILVRTVYMHTGWRYINDDWHYLSGGGAICQSGADTDIRVELDDGHMRRYALPAPVDDPRRIAGDLFGLLNVAPNNPAVGVSLFCCVVRATLGECLPIDYALYLSGQSGSQKSELAAVALACFGDFNSRTFPANFTDTESDLEHKAHQAKDAILAVDDFAPGVNQQESHKSHTKLERLVRGAGNQAGRGRRNADMTGKAAYYPRCMLVITGEDIGKGASLLGRMLIIEIKRGDVNLSFLTNLQHLARTGELSAIMAAFLQWLAPKMVDLKKTYANKVRAIRDEALRQKIATSHPRAADMYASLYAAADLYIDFAADVGAINSIRANDLMDDINEKLKAAIRAQTQYQQQTDEVERFVALLRGCFGAGECHVAGHLNQGPPEIHPHTWGWRKPSMDSDPSGCGQLIGWINQPKSEVWLEPEATFKIVQRFAFSQNDPIIMQKSTLLRRLLERGLLLTCDVDKRSGRQRPDVKRGVAGKNCRVLVVDAKLITDSGDD